MLKETAPEKEIKCFSSVLSVCRRTVGKPTKKKQKKVFS